MPEGTTPPDCDQPSPGAQPLGSLNAGELNRTIAGLLSGTQMAQAPWLSEERDDDQLWNPPVIGALHALAHDVALRLSQDSAAIKSISGCDVLVSGDATCAAKFLDQFLRRAYRRAVTDEDKDEMNAVFADGQKLGGDFASGVRAVVEVALQAPDFVYLIEQGTGESSGGAIALTGYETAARLAYFLTGSPPDAELSADADQGALDIDTLEAHTWRLLGSPANREAAGRFYQKLLRLRYLEQESDLGYTGEIAELSRKETLRFVEDITFDGAGSFRALLTEPSTWVNQPLASFYGLPGVTGAELQKVALDPSRRGGMLTQAAFLRARSHGKYTSPVQRGLGVIVPLLCYDMPPPPPDVPVDLVEPPVNATTRERLSLFTREPVCQGCHRDINPVGFAFEHYDAVGRWRDTEQGLPIDSSGELYKTDARGPFADALELAHNIADSDDARACFAQRWLEQAYRRPKDATDACVLAQVTQAFADTDGNLLELMAAVAKTDTFRYRLKSELAP
jgi:hypothetical protein